MTQSDPIPHPELEADCDRCFGLCCTALSFSRPDGFGHDKPAGILCHFLAGDYRCSIHPRREDLGYEGCIDFTCLGAGQRASQQFATQNWQRDPTTRRQMFARFAQLLKLQEIRQALIQAKGLVVSDQQEEERGMLLAAVAKIADGERDSGDDVDVQTLITRAQALITRLAKASSSDRF
ncbi:hypothetical protein [Devosia aurantiaca]|uniref:Pentapeptide repeat-containing protein n=1 Tax=Devosia aurantiaca TaxID=2714858 RepID=A0A6M1T3Q2_9HYPH|nr:hypothetical protein [Devosia aurantiaca]NGP19451.1 hypothetical protein [Devosia aurantiaca]